LHVNGWGTQKCSKNDVETVSRRLRQTASLRGRGTRVPLAQPDERNGQREGFGEVEHLVEHRKTSINEKTGEGKKEEPRAAIGGGGRVGEKGLHRRKNPRGLWPQQGGLRTVPQKSSTEASKEKVSKSKDELRAGT